MCVRLRAPNVRKHTQRKNATTTTTTRTHLKCVRKDGLEKHLSRRLLTQCHPRSARLSDVYPSTTTPLPHTFVLLAQILTPANQHNNTPTRPERTGALLGSGNRGWGSTSTGDRHNRGIQYSRISHSHIGQALWRSRAQHGGRMAFGRPILVKLVYRRARWHNGLIYVPLSAR